MCGIIGYTSKKNNVKDVVMSCLKNLEYRGYDSSGIGIIQNNKMCLYKKKGKIEVLETFLNTLNIKSSTAIAHTRWATHGCPNEINAHPHKVGSVTLVHNGIIENYNLIKEELLKKGVTFKSDTDTEVACAYINYIYETLHCDKLQTISESCKIFRGSYAFAVIFDDEIDTIYAIRKDSPLIIGLSEDGNFIASDISAILDFTKSYILLEQNMIAKVTKENVTIYNENLNISNYKISEATWNITQYKKDGYEHYMLKEINEQPLALGKLYKRYLDGKIFNDNLDLSKYSNIHIVACGSAMHAGLVGKYLLETYASIPVSIEVASEYRYKNVLINTSTLVIIISQSGETADTLAALRLAKEKKAKTLAIVNVVGSSISREADIVLYTNMGPEIAVATTKGYTSQIAMLSFLTLELMKEKNILSESLKKEIFEDFKNITNILLKVISQDDLYSKVSNKIKDENNIFFIGRGIDFATSMEGSLKLKEISYIHSEAYAAGELKHGTISLIEKETPVIAIATDDMLYEKTISNIKEIKSRGAFVIFITNKDLNLSNEYDFANICIKLPKATKFIQPIIVTIALQLIAYQTAKAKKCDIDKPRNLAKSVTVE
ncbi:MAG: glutamine--fructose-6-phosphate transaminase (isomerizing) [Clostridia bacterium]